MAKTDPELGKKVKDHLITLGLETLMQPAKMGLAYDSLSRGVLGFLANMGLDVVGDDSICDTPGRVAEMFVNELCYGLNYDNFPKCTTTSNGKEVPLPQQSTTATQILGATEEMVVVRKIQTVSLCEHHFQTITGVTHIAYIPGPKLLGLSKFVRVTNFFARRPQVQERMTEQIFAALSYILDTQDIAVYQQAVHNCMRARGAMDPSSDTVTSRMGGKFMDVPALRQEFLHAIR
jgi:GTP cyclohydrolase I